MNSSGDDDKRRPDIRFPQFPPASECAAVGQRFSMNSEKFVFSRLYLPMLGSFGLCLLVFPACSRPESTTTSAAPAASKASATTPGATPAAVPTPVAAAAANIAKVKGRWLRPDGGYILAITAIDADGRAEAGYFNPSPIRVAWARVKPEGAAVKVDVELRDQNYPGCLYKLTYVPEKDHLLGTYFQAQMQQTYEVEFVREH